MNMGNVKSDSVTERLVANDPERLKLQLELEKALLFASLLKIALWSAGFYAVVRLLND